MGLKVRSTLFKCIKCKKGTSIFKTKLILINHYYYWHAEYCESIKLKNNYVFTLTENLDYLIILKHTNDRPQVLKNHILPKIKK